MFQQIELQKDEKTDVVGVGICLINKNGYFLKANNWLEHFLGYTQVELSRITYKDITFSEDLKASELLFQELVSGRLEQYQIQKRYIRKDDKIIQMKLSVTTINDRKDLMNTFLCKFQDAQIIQEIQMDDYKEDTANNHSRSIESPAKYHSNQLNIGGLNEEQLHLLLKPKDTTSAIIEQCLKEKRQYFRIKFNTPLCADLKFIIKANGSSQTCSSKVCIIDIGPGGLKFASELRFPIGPQLVLEFTLYVVQQKIVLPGNIVHKNERQKGVFEYGVQFNIDDLMRTHITKLLNEVMIKLRNNMALSDTNLCNKKNIAECLESKVYHTKSV